jgi:CRP-like cAMP-binding protein
MVATNLCGNSLLDARSDNDRERTAPGMQILRLRRRELTHERGDRLRHVDFPIDAILSVVATFLNGDVCDVGTVGREGFVESDAALDSDHARRTSFCQVAGRVARMPVDVFRQEMRSSASFARIVRRNLSARLYTSEQFTACNLKHQLDERCATWLLMTRDRAGRNDFLITHDLLSIMLGVRRAGVSTAAAALQRIGAIEYHRGKVVVLDEALLEQAACECYATSTNAYTKSLRGGEDTD